MSRPRGFDAVSVTARPLAGASIDDACDEMTRLAVFLGDEVRFEFNEIPLVAKPKKSWDTLSREYWRASNERSEKRRADRPTTGGGGTPE